MGVDETIENQKLAQAEVGLDHDRVGRCHGRKEKGIEGMGIVSIGCFEEEHGQVRNCAFLLSEGEIAFVGKLGEKSGKR